MIMRYSSSCFMYRHAIQLLLIVMNNILTKPGNSSNVTSIPTFSQPPFTVIEHLYNVELNRIILQHILKLIYMHARKA